MKEKKYGLKNNIFISYNIHYITYNIKLSNLLIHLSSFTHNSCFSHSLTG